MNKTIRLLTVAFFSVALGLCSGIAKAKFSGPYDVSKWTVSPEGVDTSGAPSFITLYDSSLPMGEMSASSFTITAAAQSLISFNWKILVGPPEDYPSPNDFSFLHNDASTVLKERDGGPYSGSFSQHVNAGDFFGFGSCCHEHYSSFFNATISDFNVTAVPELETYAMFLAGLGLMGFISIRRKDINCPKVPYFQS